LAFSQRLYDHWRIALIFYFASSLLQSVTSAFFSRSTTFIGSLTLDVLLLLMLIPGAVYILGEYTRISGANSSSLKRLSKMMEIGLVAFIGFGLAIFRVYDIAYYAFQIALPYPPILNYVQNAGALGGELAMGIAAVFARDVGPSYVEEPEVSQSMRIWLMEVLEPLGFMLVMLGLALGIGVTALAAFFLIIAGAILVPVGYLVRKFWIPRS